MNSVPYSLSVSGTEEDDKVCSGSVMAVNWTAPRNHPADVVIGLFSRYAVDDYFFAPAESCTIVLGSVTGVCRLSTKAFAKSDFVDVRMLRRSEKVVGLLQPLSPCLGCDGVPNSGKRVDSCGICGQNGSCDGIV